MMKRIALLLLLLILSSSMSQLWAKEGQIKYGKYVEYQGNVEKINGKKIPRGKGKLVVKKQIHKNENVYLRIEGDFSDTIVSDCHVEIKDIKTSKVFSFKGDISFHIEELDNKNYTVLVSFINGYFRERYIDNGDCQAFITIGKEVENIKYKGSFKVVCKMRKNNEFGDWMDNTVTVSIGLSENGEFKHPSNEVKIGNNTYNGWVYYYDYANYYEYRPISAYLKKDSLNNVFIGESYKDLKIYSLKRDNFIFKDCYYWDEISMGVNGWIEKFQSAKGTIEYPDKKYKGIFYSNKSSKLFNNDCHISFYNGRITYPDGRMYYVQKGKSVFNVDKDIIGIWKVEPADNDIISYLIFNKDGTYRCDQTAHHADGTIDYYSVATIKITEYGHWKSINTLYQACLESPTENNKGESTVVMKLDSFYVAPLLMAYHDVPEAQKKDIIQKYQQVVDEVSKNYEHLNERIRKIVEYREKDTLNISGYKDWIKVDSIQIETGISKAEKKWLEGAGARQYQANRHKKLIESYGTEYTKAIEEGRYVVGMTKEMVREISTSWIYDFRSGGVEYWVPEYALHIHFQTPIAVEQLIFVNGKLSSIGRVMSNQVNHYARF